jgi:hypothetical protein
MSNWQLKQLPEAMARVCETPHKQEQFRNTALKFHARFQPVHPKEADLVNDMVRAYWLMNYWKRLAGDARREMRALEEGEANAPRLAELKQVREHCQWHAVKQSMFLNRRKKSYNDARAEYLRELAEAGYTLAEARAYFQAESGEREAGPTGAGEAVELPLAA